MLSRCRNPAHHIFKYYGARGISVCERWHRFENFLADMGRKPSAEHSLDRIDNSRGYSPENCRWATYKEQNRNTRSNRQVTVDGVTKTLAEWCEITGTPRKTFYNRLENMDMSEREALFTPPKTRRRKMRLQGPPPA